MAVNAALKQLTDFDGDPAELQRKLTQFERNAAEKTRETDRSARSLEERVAALETDVGAVVNRTTADFSKTSNTTLADVDGLEFAIAAGETWTVEWAMYVTLSAGGGIKVAVTVPSGGTVVVWGVFNASAGVNNTIGNTTTPGAAVNLTPAAGTTGVVSVYATVTADSADGTVALQAAQNASNATPTVITAGAHVRATRVP